MTANPDNERLKLQQLLQQKVSSTDIQYLLDADPKLTTDLRQNILKLKDCADTAAFQALQDSYDLALFSPEIATPLSKPLSDKSSVSASQAKQAQQQILALIESSQAIAWVSIADRQQLSAVQQANYTRTIKVAMFSKCSTGGVAILLTIWACIFLSAMLILRKQPGSG